MRTAGHTLLASRVVSELDGLVEFWLGYAAPPPAAAVRAAGFRPDGPDAYCPRCGDSVGPGEVTETGCASCRGNPAVADRVVRLGAYVDQLRDWILAIKYERWALMGQHLGATLGDALSHALHGHTDNVLVAPMPMPWQRRLYRGIDHAQVIASSAARRIDAPLVRLLAKRHGPPQVTLSPTDRIKLGGRNLRVCRRLGGWRLAGEHVIIIDDVRTTGTTMRRAVRLLRALGSPPAGITAAFLAVADPASRRVRHGDAPPGDL